MLATAALTSLGTTSPRYIRQQAMHLLPLGSHLAIMLDGSKTAFVIVRYNLVVIKDFILILFFFLFQFYFFLFLMCGK
jgi:hypothetical protein